MNRNIPLLSIAVAAAFAGTNANAALVVSNPAEISYANTTFSDAPFTYDAAYDFNGAPSAISGVSTPFSDTFTNVTVTNAVNDIAVILNQYSGGSKGTLTPSLFTISGGTLNSPVALTLSGLNTVRVGAGTYTITFAGTQVGNTSGPTATGSYDGSVYTAPVPEASAWAMMILGLGMVGFAARRRSQSTTVSYAF